MNQHTWLLLGAAGVGVLYLMSKDAKAAQNETAIMRINALGYDLTKTKSRNTEVTSFPVDVYAGTGGRAPGKLIFLAVASDDPLSWALAEYDSATKKKTVLEVGPGVLSRTIANQA